MADASGSSGWPSCVYPKTRGKSNKFPLVANRTWLTIQQAADELQVNARTIWSEIHRGNLKASRVGAQWRIRRESLDDYLAPVTP